MRFFFFLAVLSVFLPVIVESTYGAYFVNWAKYRPAPYTYTAGELSAIVNKVDEIYYSFYYFCPPAGTNPMPYWAMPPYGSCSDATEYQLMSVEPSDTQYIPTVVGYKSRNPKLKVYLSVGGWNFPSAYFSKMVSSSQSRSKFIASAVSTLNQYNIDGLDIDWEFPVSPPRSNPVEISCTDFRTVSDAGGSSADTTNIVTFFKELRSGLGSKLITVASQAAKLNEDNMNIRGVTPYINKWHIMSYDYAVSDLPDASAAVTSPNCPLFTPDPPAVQMSLNQTVHDYFAAGVSPSKIMIGLPLYGHTWYTPGLTDWKTFGNKGQLQGRCCGPFQQTYGAQPGKGSSLCGTMMYSEIQAAQPETFYDTKTQSAIGYLTKAGADGYTAQGTWITYNDKQSVSTIAQYSKSLKLDGVFIFDTSEDSISGGQHTYELMSTIATVLGK